MRSQNADTIAAARKRRSPRSRRSGWPASRALDAAACGGQTHALIAVSRSSGRHAPLCPPQRHDQGRAQGRAHAQARLRRGREPPGIAQGAGQFCHRRRPQGGRDPARRTGAPRAPATASSARKAAATRAPTRPTPGSSIRSTAPRTSCTAFRISRSRSRSSAKARSWPALIYNPANDDLFTAERGKGAFLNDTAPAGGGAPTPRRRRDRLRAAASRPRRPRARRARDRGRAAARSRACGGSAPPRSISPGSPPDGSTPIGSATSRRGTSPPG